MRSARGWSSPDSPAGRDVWPAQQASAPKPGVLAVQGCHRLLICSDGAAQWLPDAKVVRSPDCDWKRIVYADDMEMGRIENRGALNIAARVHTSNVPLIVESVSVENISSRGARVRARRAWRAHERLVLTGMLGDFRADAEVVYCQRLGPDECAIGLKFDYAVVTERLLSDTGTYRVVISDN